MTKTIAAEGQVRVAELQLFAARRSLEHLVEMYNSGRWRLYYKTEQAFLSVVREQREAVDRWTNVVGADKKRLAATH
jgi:uncharacterized repeat protein (TIGR03809 family)